MEGVRISYAEYANAKHVPEKITDVPEKPANYPDPTMYGPLPAYGLFMRHARDVTMRDVKFDAPKKETRPAMVTDDVEGLKRD